LGRIARETVINAAPEKVFEYVADMPRHSEWGQHDLTVNQTSAGAAGVGSTFASVAHQFGVQKETQTVVDYTPGKRFAFDATGSIGTVRHAFELEPVGGGTKVTKTMEIFKPSLMARVMGPIIRSKTKAGLAVDLERIKAKLEG
jgi:uncharacterized protein YndB with AHSA1/START domain